MPPNCYGPYLDRTGIPICPVTHDEAHCAECNSVDELAIDFAMEGAL